MAEYRHPRVFTVAPGVPFLPAVAAALCDGALVPGFAFDGDPLKLSSATIYVPTRRAARELRSAFLDHLGGETILLPHIRPLGEFDEDAGLFEGDGETAIDIPPAVDATQRLLLLGTMIRSWTKHLKIDVGRLYGGETIQTPVSAADAFWLARDLAGLMDQFSTEQVAVADIGRLDTSELSDWWKVTLAFLEIMRNEWPAILESLDRVDPGEHRNLRLTAEAKRLTAYPPDGPIIVAGSTGTIPATAELITAVSRLPNGAVVLPGFDTRMDEATRESLAHAEEVASIIGHPQFGLGKLVGRIGIAPEEIPDLGHDLDDAREARRLWVAESLRPANVTDRWTETRPLLSDAAFDEVAYLAAPNEHQEAAAIAAALREAVNEPEAIAALVTPDRNLARRVVSELARYGIEARDTGGMPLHSTEQGTLLTLVLDVVFNPGDPATLLALAKHPLVTVSAAQEDHAHAVDLFELAVLRGGPGRFDPADLAAFAQWRNEQLLEERKRNPQWFDRMDADDFETIASFTARFSAALEPLTSLRARDGEVPLAALVEATVKVLEALARDGDGSHAALYADEEGAVLRGMLAALLASDVPLSLEPGNWPQLVEAVMADAVVKPPPGGHPRIAIWGTLEARLQTVDLMILGGLNEGTWPGQTQNDQFLTRGMKGDLGLEPPERRIGLSAHDFQMAMGQKRVILSRSERSEGAPSIASRWLQRMMTFAGEEPEKRMREEGARYLDLARRMETAPDVPFAKRPYAVPPIEARPTSLSVTEVETLIRDPYAVYARKVLKLKPVDELVRDPGAAERGSLFHAIFEEVVEQKIDPTAPDAEARMIDVARDLFAAEKLPSDIQATWWPRIEAGVKGIARWERERAETIAERLAEISANRIPIDETGVSLGGRADRLDIRKDGAVDIIDFKTGAQPSAKVVQAMLAPQLPLEGALIRRGAFRGAGTEIGDMLYVKVGARGGVEGKSMLKVDKNTILDPAEMAEQSWRKLVAMMAWYGIAQNGYQSQRMPQKIRDREGDYDHLARVREWRTADEASGNE